MKRIMIQALLLSCVLLSLSGCATVITGGIREVWDWREGIGEELGELRDAFKLEVSEILGLVSRYELTGDGDLQGVRAPGEDAYTGTYTAAYDGFSGREILFGGAALKPSDGRKLTVTYTLEITEGSGTLCILRSGEEHIVTGEQERLVITEVSASGTYEVTLSDGDFWIAVEGEGLSGTLSILSEYHTAG